MRYEITLPSEFSAKGRIVVGRWHKEIGDLIQKEDVVLQIETPTTILEIESEVEGVLADICHDAGEEVTADDVLGVIDEQSEPGIEEQGEAEEFEVEAEPEQETAEEEAEEESVSTESDEETPVTETAEEVTAQAEEPPAESAAARRPITDRARWLATASGLNFSNLSGSGPGGRIIVRDVEDAIARQREKEAEAPAPKPAAAKQVLLTPAEQVLVQRMSQAHRDVPQYDVTMTADSTNLLAWRKRQTRAPRITAIIVKLCAEILPEHPRINGTFLGRSWRANKSADIAVAVDAEHGMAWPVLRNCQQKSLKQIADELVELAQRAREGKLSSQDVSDANFAVTNLGMFGVESFNAVILPGHAAVLAIGSIRQLPTVVGGAILARPMIRLTLGCDRRIVEGAFGARFLGRLKELIAASNL